MESDENPFRSPEAYSPPVAVGVSRERYAFVSGHGRAVAVMFFLAVGMCMDAAGIGSSLIEAQMLSRMQQGSTVQESEIESSDARQGLIGVGQLAIYVGTAIAFLMWFHRAHRNLPALGAPHLEYSPGWAVGGFFVPILNLYRPYQVMREVWRGSDPEPAGIQAAFLKHVRLSPLVGWWWALWIIMGIAEQAAFRASLHAQTVDALLAATWVDIFSDVVSLPAALVTILMVRAIDANQEKRNRILSSSGSGFTESGMMLSSG